MRNFGPALVVHRPVEPSVALPVLDDVTSSGILDAQNLASLENIVVAVLRHLDQPLALFKRGLGVAAAGLRRVSRTLVCLLDDGPLHRMKTQILTRFRRDHSRILVSRLANRKVREHRLLGGA